MITSPSSFPTPGGRGWGVLQTRGQKGCVASAPLIQSGVKRRESFHHQIMFHSSHLRVLAYCPVNSQRHPPPPPQPKSHFIRLLLRVFCRQLNAFICMPCHSSRDVSFFSKLISYAIILLLHEGSRNFTKEVSSLTELQNYWLSIIIYFFL